MSFFELFRILFATHFVLGIFLALRLWIGVFAVLGLFAMPEITSEGAGYVLAVGVLSLLWYYVWYGSIVFALRGHFPVFSIRVFSMILAIVYAGLVIAYLVNSPEAWANALMQHPVYFAFVAAMLLIAACGLTILPSLKTAADQDEGRIAQARDRQFDQLHPWGKRSAGPEESDGQ